MSQSRSSWPGVVEQYRRFLPVKDKTPVVTLLEGNTPLIRGDRFAAAIGADVELYVKFEGMNPTASFKDRGMTLGLSQSGQTGGIPGSWMRDAR